MKQNGISLILFESYIVKKKNEIVICFAVINFSFLYSPLFHLKFEGIKRGSLREKRRYYFLSRDDKKTHLDKYSWGLLATKVGVETILVHAKMGTRSSFTE